MPCVDDRSKEQIAFDELVTVVSGRFQDVYVGITS